MQLFGCSGWLWFITANLFHINCFHSSYGCPCLFALDVSNFWSESQSSHWHCYPEGFSILMTHPSAPNGPLSPTAKCLSRKAEEIEWNRAGSAKNQDTIDRGNHEFSCFDLKAEKVNRIIYNRIFHLCPFEKIEKHFYYTPISYFKSFLNLITFPKDLKW